MVLGNGMEKLGPSPASQIQCQTSKKDNPHPKFKILCANVELCMKQTIFLR
jgi:hypothetical protein